jgi:hypothetical protein
VLISVLQILNFNCLEFDLMLAITRILILHLKEFMAIAIEYIVVALVLFNEMKKTV